MYSKEINEYANAVVDTLIKTADLIDVKQIDKIVKIIKNSEKIILFGTGGSGIVCRDLYLKLIKLGYFVIYEKDEHLQEFISQNSNSNDVIIIFSYSGPQEKILKNIKLCHENNSKSIIITNKKKNNQNYSEVIYVNSTETQIRDISILSRIAMQMISDLIVLKIIDK